MGKIKWQYCLLRLQETTAGVRQLRRRSEQCRSVLHPARTYRIGTIVESRSSVHVYFTVFSFLLLQAPFRGLIHTHLERFTNEELQKQLKGLSTLLAAIEAQNPTLKTKKSAEVPKTAETTATAPAGSTGAVIETPFGAVGITKTRRRMIRHAMEDIRHQLNVRAETSAAPSAPTQRWCRACQLLEDQHDGPLGSCWGMYVGLYFVNTDSWVLCIAQL